ncbi:MAG: TetR/AcrR family transcriptional regulator [Dehalococcoidales bacterium]
MYKEQTNKVAIRTQNAVADAFLDLLQEYDYEDISITEICKRADIVRKTFYNNFQSKDDIVRYRINHIFQELESTVDLRYMSVKRILLIAFGFVMDYREALLLFYRRGLLNRFAGKSITSYITKDHILSKLDKDTIDPKAYKYITAQISAVIISVIETWIENDFEESVDFLAGLTEELMYKPNGANNLS